MFNLRNKQLLCHLCENVKNALMDANFYIYAFSDISEHRRICHFNLKE